MCHFVICGRRSGWTGGQDGVSASGKKELGVMDDISFQWFYTFVGGRNFLFLFMLSLLNLGAFCWDSIVGVEKGGLFFSPPYIFILVFWFLES